MTVQVPGLLTDVAAIITAVTIIVGGAVAMTRLPMVRWVWRRLVVDPAGDWFRAQTTEATAGLSSDVAEMRAQVRDTGHLASYHLGSNDTTVPIHERIRRLEIQVGLEPVEQQRHDPHPG